MKKTIKSLLAIAVAALTFHSCADVPEPYQIPDGGGSGGNLPEGTIFKQVFSSEKGDFIIKNLSMAEGLSGSDIWTTGASYIKATTYLQLSGETAKKNHNADSWLISPKVSLKDLTTAYVILNHSTGYLNGAKPATCLKVMVSDNYTDGAAINVDDWKDIEIDNWYTGTSFEFVDGNGDLNCSVSGGDYGSVVIPVTEGDTSYHITVEGGTVSADSVLIQSGATLHIIGEGRLSCTNITGDGFLELENISNLPAGMAVYDYFEDEYSGDPILTDISGDPNWGWFTFSYHSEEGKWIVCDYGGGGDGPAIPEYETVDAITAEKYQEEIWGDFTAHIYRANGSYGSVTVPQDCYFDILADSVITNALIMEMDGIVHYLH